MTVFDLMDIYYPDKKRTISRLRNMDKFIIPIRSGR